MSGTSLTKLRIHLIINRLNIGYVLPYKTRSIERQDAAFYNVKRRILQKQLLLSIYYFIFSAANGHIQKQRRRNVHHQHQPKQCLRHSPHLHHRGTILVNGYAAKNNYHEES